MEKICNISGKKFEMTQEDLKFYKMMGVSTPTLCPEERQIRRLVWQNMSNLYYRTCDATGKKIITNFSSEKDYIIYEQNYWWSDKWDFRDYGFKYDFDKSFFSQWEKLLKTTPLPCLFTEFSKDINSAFTNFAGYNKNCYLIFHADMNEDCYFATGLKNTKNAVDSLNVFNVEQSYECIDCKDSYNIKYCQDCDNCSNSWFLRNCRGCKYCFGSMNLENKEYYLFNKNITKEEYEKFILDFESGKYDIISLLHKKFIDFQKNQIQKNLHGFNNEDCLGDHIFDCLDVKESFDVKESRNMKFCERIYNGPNADCYDVDQFGMNIEKIYECANIGVNCNNDIGCLYSYNLINVYYSIFCFNCEDCFGCVGLKNQKYCIFNKIYNKEEYFELKEKIINHMKKTLEWGEFFPINLTPFCYNETVANEYNMLNKEEIIKKGFKYKEIEQSTIFTGPKYNIPNNISDIGDEILDKILECETCDKNFRIVGPELDFYRKNTLPIPRKCPNCRHLYRTKLRNPRKLFERKCDKCLINIKTTFSPDRTETVYCQKCYNKEFY